jgi:hypothetical protein
MKRIHYLLLGLLVSLTIAATGPGLPPTRIAPGANTTVVTNGVNSFTISSSAGGSGAQLDGTNVFTGTNTFTADVNYIGPVSIVPASGTGEFFITGTNATSKIQITSYRNSAITHSTLKGYASRGTLAAPVALNAGDNILTIEAYGRGTNGFLDTLDTSASIELYAAQGFSNETNKAGAIRFKVTNTNSNYKAVALTINSDLAITAAAALTATGYKVSGNQVVGARAAAVANATGGTVIDVEARAQLNALLAILRTHGLIAP